jgi:glutathione S-transferase
MGFGDRRRGAERMIVVHHLNNSKSQRILWLLEELNLDYEIKHYKRLRSGMAPPEMQIAHPLGKAPIVEIDGAVLAESGAVVQYILERHGGGRLMPEPASPDYPRFLELLHYAEGSISPPIIMALLSNLMKVDNPTFIGMTDSMVRTHLDFVASLLELSDYLIGGEFSAADIQLTFILQMASGQGLLDSRSHLRDYVARMEGRPAYKRAIEKGGPFDVSFGA